MPDPSARIFIKVKGDAAIYVPAAPRFLTTYVLLEQEDWFEKEIGFVRRLLRRGMRALDIGANYGIYAAAIAASIGAAGRLWAFEPASRTASHLRRTIERNRMTNTTLLQLALSDRKGVAHLHLHDNSELNSLSVAVTGATEEVALSTLDHEAARAGWGEIDFVKLDAEGEEARILDGGRTFFTEQSPLVMFELKHGENWNLPLLDAFRGYGYSLYRLVGPDVALVPFSSNQAVDAYELNLFAAKPDRAAALEADGVLTRSAPAEIASLPGSGVVHWADQSFSKALPPASAASDPVYREALDLYAVWCDDERNLAERCAALLKGVDAAQTAIAARGSPGRLSTYARLAYEAGRRADAAAAVSHLLRLLQQQPPAFDEPCWPALARYDRLPPNTGPAEWLTAAAAEALVRWETYSGYFVSAPHILDILDWLQTTRFASPELERRRQLLGWRAGRPAANPPPALLQQQSAEHLNPNLWRGAHRLIP